MGRTAIYLHANVRAVRIELAAPVGMHDGDQVDVVLLTDSHAGKHSPRRPLLEICLSHDPFLSMRQGSLSELLRPHRSFEGPATFEIVSSVVSKSVSH
jgi:hypothetical protein